MGDEGTEPEEEEREMEAFRNGIVCAAEDAKGAMWQSVPVISEMIEGSMLKV